MSQHDCIQPDTPLARAQYHFRLEFGNAAVCFDAARVCAAQGRLKDAADKLREAGVLWYRCVLSVYGLKEPETSEIGALRAAAEQVAPQLADAWPTMRDGDRILSEKLMEFDFRIPLSQPPAALAQDVELCEAKLERLGRAVHWACSDHIAQLKADCV